MVFGRKSDHKEPVFPVAGYWTAFFINVFALAPTVGLMFEGKGISGTPLAWIPWLVNLVIIIGSLWWFPGFAIGYLLGVTVAFAAALSFMPSCVGACSIGIAMGDSMGMLVFVCLMILFILFWLAVGVLFSKYTFRQAGTTKRSRPPSGDAGEAAKDLEAGNR